MNEQDYIDATNLAKAGTDKAETGGIRAAQLQLGHSKMSMTEHYTRGRKGDKVTPTK